MGLSPLENKSHIFASPCNILYKSEIWPSHSIEVIVEEICRWKFECVNFIYLLDLTGSSCEKMQFELVVRAGQLDNVL